MLFSTTDEPLIGWYLILLRAAGCNESRFAATMTSDGASLGKTHLKGRAVSIVAVIAGVTSAVVVVVVVVVTPVVSIVAMLLLPRYCSFHRCQTCAGTRHRWSLVQSLGFGHLPKSTVNGGPS